MTTPIIQQQIQKRKEELAGKPIGVAQKGGRYIQYTGPYPIPGPTQTQGYDSPEEAPNYDKLTRGERWGLARIAGFGETQFGQTLAKWSDGWLGKVLNVIDVGAEGLERLTGFGTQWAIAQGSPEGEAEFTQNLRNAWYAGSLAADVADTPIWDSANSRYVTPGDLGGMQSLVQARRRIGELVQQGAEPKDALAQTRAELYEDMGALAFRMQLHDAAFHILADPINIAAGFLKPVERTNRFLAHVGTKVFRSQADEIIDTARIADQALDAQKAALVAANQADDAEQVARLTADLPGFEQAAKDAQAFAEYAVKNKMSPAEEWIGRIFRVAPDEPAKGIAAWKLNPLALTPGSRSLEYMNRVLDNISTLVLSRVSDPEEILRIVRRSTDGLFTPELGAHIITAEGRATRTALQTAIAHVEDATAAYRMSEQFEGPLIRGLANALGSTPAHVVERLRGGELPALAEKLAEYIATPQGRPLAELLQAAGFNLDPQGILAATDRLRLFEQFPAWDPEMSRYVLHNKLIDGIQEQAIKLFGVSAQGSIHQFSDALKAAESLAFLKMNPTYPIINGINNFATMITTGSFGNPFTHYDDLFKSLGLAEPARFRVGIGFAGLGETSPEIMSAFEKASQIVRGVERGDPTWVSKLGNWFRERQGLGFAKLSQSFEAKASVRSFGAGFSRYMREAWKPGKGFQKLADYNPNLAGVLGPEVSRRVERMVQSARSPAELKRVFEAANPDLNMANILETASEQSGLNIDNILGPDFTSWMGQELVTAAQEGPQSLGRAVSRIEKMVQRQIDNQMAVAVEVITREAAVRTTTEGPAAMPRIISEVMDDMWGTQSRHSIDMGKIADELALIRDPELRGRFWDRLMRDNDAFYTRTWRRMEASINGANQGLDEAMVQLQRAGKLTPDLEKSLKNFQRELSQTYKNWSKGWREFYDRRIELYKELKGTPKAEWGAKFDAIEAELDTRYGELINAEDAHLLHMDELVASRLDDATRQTYSTYRNTVAVSRTQLRESVLGFRRSIRGLTAREKERLWQEFWKEYRRRSDELRDLERTSRIAMSGVPEAQADMAARVGPAVAAPEAVVDTLRAYDEAVTAVEEARQGVTELGRLDSLFQARTAAKRNLDDLLSERGITLEEARSLAPEAAAEAPRPTTGTVTFQEGPGQFRTFETSGGVRIAGTEAKADAAGEHVITKVGDEYIVSDPETGIMTDGPYDDLEELVRFYEPRETAEELAARFATPVEAAPEVAAVPEVAPTSQFVGAMDVFEQFGIPRQQVFGEAIDQLWFTRGSSAMEAIEEATRDIASRPPLTLDIPQEAQNAFRAYLDRVQNDMGSSLQAGYRMGEYHRDASLLNYNRRMNYNTWLGVMAPYEFWFTQSMGKWAFGALDRHRVLSTYLRMQKLLETAYRPESGFPARLRGLVRIPMPFLPSWMGKDLFIDPLGAILPIKRFAWPFQQITEEIEGDRQRTERTLEEMLNDNKITQQDYDFALQQQAGPIWDQAVDLSRMDDSQERMDAFDFMSMLISPHAPLQWAYNIARGTPERIQPFLPITRSIRAATAMLGIAPETGGLNVEGAVRKALGLPAYDRWDDYRVDRMLSNMVAGGVVSVGDAIQAMNDREGPAFQEAVRRAGIEFGWGAMGSIIGIPSKAYPEGEEQLRELKNDYEAAWAAHESGDTEAVNRFYEEHPEYEARLALWKTPEERMQQFLVDNIWDIYNDLPQLHKQEVREQLGDLFQSAFLSRDTRSYDSIPNEILQGWLKVMGGDPPGQVHFSETLTPIQFTDPDIAFRYQTFYETRDQTFRYSEVVWPLQEDYFRLQEGQARRDFLKRHPILKQYWDWRRDFMYRNPDVAPYIEDDPEKLPRYPSEAALREVESQQPGFTWVEWSQMMGPSLSNLVLDYFEGQPLPRVAQDKLEGMGLGGWEEVLASIDAVAP